MEPGIYLCNMNRILKLYNKINRYGQINGLKLEVLSPGHIRYEMKVLDDHLATPIAIHGGVLSAMMDAVLGVAALSYTCENDELVSTVEFKINFLSPAGPDDVLIGEGNLIRVGRRLIVAEGYIDDMATGRKVAAGLGTFYPYHISKSGILDHLDEDDIAILGEEWVRKNRKSRL